jgi:hypothetical protein
LLDSAHASVPVLAAFVKSADVPGDF